MKFSLYLIIFLFSTFFLSGCGDEENGDGRPQQSSAGTGTGASTGADAGAGETDQTNPLIEQYNRQRAQLIEKYNTILKPNAPLPVSTKQTVCTKEDKSINLEVNEYIEDITIKGNGNDLLCDFLIDEEIDKFATVDGEYCTKEANKIIDKLKAEEGYTCPDLQ